MDKTKDNQMKNTSHMAGPVYGNSDTSGNYKNYVVTMCILEMLTVIITMGISKHSCMAASS